MQKTTSLLALFAILVCGACDPLSPSSSSLDDTPGSTSWRAVGAGTYNSCAVDAAGAPYCWGFDLVDMCSNTGPVCTVLFVPTRFPAAAAPLKSVVVGALMACGLGSDSNVYCWGEALAKGSLGDGVTKKSRVPVRVALPGPVTQISAGYTGECALMADGTVWCWTDSSAPEILDSQVRFAKLSTGYPQCAIAENADAYCWGGGYGRLGIAEADTACQYGPSCLYTKVPQLVAGNHKWIDIAVGSVSACGITTEHRAYCWGEMYSSSTPDGPRGLLGVGSFVGSKSPLPVVGDLQFNTVSVGNRNVCAVAVDKSAYCWGQNASGQLAVGVPGPPVASPQRVAGQLSFEALSVAEVTCGVSAGKNLFCWGNTYAGALGIGPTGAGWRSTPTRTSSPTG